MLRKALSCCAAGSRATEQLARLVWHAELMLHAGLHMEHNYSMTMMPVLPQSEHPSRVQAIGMRQIRVAPRLIGQLLQTALQPQPDMPAL